MNILDRRFKYIPAAKTDVKKTFARIKRQLQAEQDQREKNAAEAREKVAPMVKKAGAR